MVQGKRWAIPAAIDPSCVLRGSWTHTNINRSCLADREHCPSTVLLCTALTLALAAIFYIPYVIPEASSPSLSYAFGYNNHAAVALTISCSILGALWLRHLPVVQFSSDFDVPIHRMHILFALAGTAVVCAVALPLIITKTPIGDAAYLINRIELLSVGKKPYIDFEYAYGPLFLYLPLWMARLLGIGLTQAYYVFWVVIELSGIIVLASVINAIEIPGKLKPAIFLLLCAASGAACVVGAATYSWLRFAVAPFLAFKIYSIQPESTSQSRRIWFIGVLVVTTFAMLMLLSPEIALAFAAGTSIFSLLRGNIRSSEWWAAYVSMLAMMTALLIAADSIHLLDTLKRFGSGARDFPLFPAGHLLLFVPCVLISGIYLARSVFDPKKSRSVLLLLISLPMLSAALGSGDPLHVVCNGFGFLAIGMMWIGQSSRSWRFVSIWFCLFFVVMIFEGLVIERYQEFATLLSQYTGHPTNIVQIDRNIAFPGSEGVLEAPFGFGAAGSGSGEFESYDAPWIDTGHFFGTVNAPSIQDVQVKIQELEEHPEREVLVPAKFEKSRRLDKNVKVWLEIEYAAPYFQQVKHQPRAYALLCNYLDSHYHRILGANSNSFNYEVWQRN